jgi:hypothetical protein
MDSPFKTDDDGNSRATICSRAFESQNDPPPTTSRNISQPVCGNNKFEHGEHGGHREERPRQHRRQHESFRGMVFDSMTISTQDVAEANRLAEETSLPTESFATKGVE